MTVSYTGSLTKQLLRWKGSLWKALWTELLVFIVAYYIIQFSYLFAMSPDQQRIMEKIVKSVDSNISIIPLQFLLGFFINKVRRGCSTLNHITEGMPEVIRKSVYNGKL